MIRPVYAVIREVASPHLLPVDITRCDQWTLIAAHPGSCTPEVAQEIAQRLDSDSELAGWANGFTRLAINLNRLRHDTIGYLDELDSSLLRIPCRNDALPQGMHAPWLTYP